jgi:hypothetical protein
VLSLSSIIKLFSLSLKTIVVCRRVHNIFLFCVGSNPPDIKSMILYLKAVEQKGEGSPDEAEFQVS